LRGAEAVVTNSKLLSYDAVVKERIAKSYRIPKIDLKLRSERTRSEARLLHKAKLAGVIAPTVLEVGEFTLIMTKLSGKRPAMDKRECKEAGRLLAALHKSDIIHGDYTPANLLVEKGKMQVIDFGLGFVSNEIEHKAVDVFTMLRAIGHKKEFLAGYDGSKTFLKRVEEIEKRVRYAI